jgi:hypothetical protein
MDLELKVVVVRLIACGDAERALSVLAEHYGVRVPRLRVGLPKGRRRNLLGCYIANTRTISVLDSDVLKNPFVILHEFYHHLRTTVSLEHRGNERNANEFARSFIQAYQSTVVEGFKK